MEESTKKEEFQTLSVKPGDKFYMNVPTTTNPCVDERKRDNPRHEAAKSFVSSLNDDLAKKIIENRMSEDEMRDFLVIFKITMEFPSQFAELASFLSDRNFRVSGNVRLLYFLRKNPDPKILHEILACVRG